MIMEPEVHFEHTVQAFSQQMAYFMRQLPPQYLARFDRDVFFSAFSMVVDNVRVGLQPSIYRPGWSGSDTKIGTKYTQNIEDLSSEELRRLHNSDHDTDAPYGNKQLLVSRERWRNFLRENSSTIPLCVVTEALYGGSDIGGSKSARQG
jgi:hypothetical protein